MKKEGGSALRGDIPGNVTLPVSAPPPSHSHSHTPELSPASSGLRTRSLRSRGKKAPGPALQELPGEVHAWARKPVMMMNSDRVLKTEEKQEAASQEEETEDAGVRPQRDKTGRGHWAQESGRPDKGFETSVVNMPQARWQSWTCLDS